MTVECLSDYGENLMLLIGPSRCLLDELFQRPIGQRYLQVWRMKQAKHPTAGESWALASIRG